MTRAQKQQKKKTYNRRKQQKKNADRREQGHQNEKDTRKMIEDAGAIVLTEDRFDVIPVNDEQSGVVFEFPQNETPLQNYNRLLDGLFQMMLIAERHDGNEIDDKKKQMSAQIAFVQTSWLHALVTNNKKHLEQTNKMGKVLKLAMKAILKSMDSFVKEFLAELTPEQITERFGIYYFEPQK